MIIAHCSISMWTQGACAGPCPWVRVVLYGDLNPLQSNLAAITTAGEGCDTSLLGWGHILLLTLGACDG